MSQERERLLLEEEYPDGAVATGFSFRFETVAQPVERVLFEIGNREGVVLVRLWFEIDQFAQFVEEILEVASDAGVLQDDESA